MTAAPFVDYLPHTHYFKINAYLKPKISVLAETRTRVLFVLWRCLFSCTPGTPPAVNHLPDRCPEAVPRFAYPSNPCIAERQIILRLFLV